MSVKVDTDSSGLVLSEWWNYNAAYTVSLWFRPDSLNSAAHYLWFLGVDYINTTTPHDGLWINSSNEIVAEEYSSVLRVKKSSALTQGQWYHAAFVRSSATLWTGYLDGVELSSASMGDVSARAAPTILCFGNHQLAGDWEANGAIAHVKVWTAALSVDEVAIERRSIRPQVQLASLWAWWPLIATA